MGRLGAWPAESFLLAKGSPVSHAFFPRCQSARVELRAIRQTVTSARRLFRTGCRLRFASAKFSFAPKFLIKIAGGDHRAGLACYQYSSRQGPIDWRPDFASHRLLHSVSIYAASRRAMASLSALGRLYRHQGNTALSDSTLPLWACAPR